MPVRWTATGTPCTVTLGAYGARAGDVDIFNLRVIGLRAVEIQDYCGVGEGRISFGGRAPIGGRDLFWVEVDSGLAVGRGVA